ncbi:MAG: sensor histidine kinase [Angustibacter sp.]
MARRAPAHLGVVVDDERPSWFRGGVRTRLLAMAVVPTLAFLGIYFVSSARSAQTQVDGPLYDQIVSNKDLIADVLPPPQFIIESYLTVVQLSENENISRRDELIANLARLEAEYRDRHRVWQRDLSDPELRQALLIDAHDPAVRLFQLANEQLVPDVRAGEYEDAEELAGDELRLLYEQHRAGIDKVVQRARAQQIEVERNATAAVRRDRLILGGVFGAMTLLTLLFGLGLARAIVRPLRRLEKVVREDLPRFIDRARRTDLTDQEGLGIESVAINTPDELGRATVAFDTAVRSAVELAAEQARQRRETSETFIHLGRRNQSLVSRQLRHIDELERAESDPDQLRHLFRLDHLATRMRRNAESLLVLAGVEPARKWKQPVSVFDVVRASLGEVEGYERVRLETIQPAMVPGFAVADLTHMLAELVENALRYSPPDTPVTVTSGHLGATYQVAIVDHGMGMGSREVEETNRRLSADPSTDRLPSGSLGLYVVARLAARYGITVEVDSGRGDGLTAYVSLPAALLEQAGPTPIHEMPRTAGVFDSVASSMAQPSVFDPIEPRQLPVAAMSSTPAPMAIAQSVDPHPGTWRSADRNGVATAPTTFEPPAPQSGSLPALPAASAAPPPAFHPPPPAAFDPPPPARPPSIFESPRPQPPVSSPPQIPHPSVPAFDLGGDPGTDQYTSAGLRRRSSRLQARPGPVATPTVVPRYQAPGERDAGQVRSRYDAFTAGKRRALDTPHDPEDR